jgi:hypothetical protein
MKSTNIKIVSIVVFVMTFILNFHTTKHLAYAASPLDKETTWEPVGMTLNQLLNSGWQISGHSVYRVATSPGASGYRPYDETQYSFILTKNGKYVICLVLDPRPSMATSACRKLN